MNWRKTFVHSWQPHVYFLRKSDRLLICPTSVEEKNMRAFVAIENKKSCQLALTALKTWANLL
jgi:hypothetical protein